MNTHPRFRVWQMAVVCSLLTALGILAACAPMTAPVPATGTPTPSTSVLDGGINRPIFAQLSGEQVGPEEVVITVSVWAWSMDVFPTDITLTLPAEVTPLDNNPVSWQVNLAKGQYFTQTVRAKVEAFSEGLTFGLIATQANIPPVLPGTCSICGGDFLYMYHTVEGRLELSHDMYFGVHPTYGFGEGVITSTPGPSETPDPNAPHRREKFTQEPTLTP